jgi:hypothetical protein
MTNASLIIRVMRLAVAWLRPAFTNYLRGLHHQLREFKLDTLGRPVGFGGDF